MMLKDRYNKSFAKFTRPVGEQEAPHLHAVVAELCAKAGTAKPQIFFVDSQKLAELVEQKKASIVTEFQLNRFAAASHIDQPALIMGDKFRSIMGHHTAGAEINEEFKAILAHEIGHLKRGDAKLNKMLIMNKSPYLGMLAGISGIWLYEHLNEKKTALKKTGASEDVITASIQRDLNDSTAPSTNVATIDDLARIAKYTAGALLGFGAGFGAYALHGRYVEFGADKISAELMGSGKPLANAITHLRAELTKEIKSHPEIAEKAQHMSIMSKLFAHYSHPSDAARLERLNNWTQR